jgi:hypothetical protein
VAPASPLKEKDGAVELLGLGGEAVIVGASGFELSTVIVCFA